jgi:hypothetical protein
MKRFALLALLAFPLLIPQLVQSVFGQQATSQTAASDPQAVALAAQALAALGTTQVNDATLSGTVTRTIGPDVETGTLTLKARASVQSRIDLNLQDGTLSEIRTTASDGSPVGSWISNGTAHPMAIHNCLTDAAWFFPRLSVLNIQALTPNSVLKYVGQEMKGGRSVQHLTYFVQPPSGNLGDLAQHLTVEDIYLDSTSLLLVALTYNEHPDNNAVVDIPLELDFSDYRAVGGIQVPFRIQKTFNGSLLLDITVQSAALNSGLTNSDFTGQ